MNALLLAGWIALLAFTVLHAVGAAASAVLAAFLRRRKAVLGDRALLWMRFLPAGLAACAAVGVVVPAFLAWEPAQGSEAIGVRGLLVAGVAALPLVAGAWRGLASWRLTRSLVRSWERSARKIDLEGGLPAYEIEHAFPLVSLAGIRSPRLFIARPVRAALSPAQLAAVLSHERSHLESRDNLKRLAMQAWPSWSALLGRRSPLERDWSEAAEARADASLRPPSAVLDLAEALLVLARLSPPEGTPMLAVSSITGTGGLPARIARLLGRADQPAAVPAPRRSATAFVAAAAAIVLALSATHPVAWRAVHEACELLVRVLA